MGLMSDLFNRKRIKTKSRPNPQPRLYPPGSYTITSPNQMTENCSSMPHQQMYRMNNQGFGPQMQMPMSYDGSMTYAMSYESNNPSPHHSRRESTSSNHSIRSFHSNGSHLQREHSNRSLHRENSSHSIHAIPTAPPSDGYIRNYDKFIQNIPPNRLFRDAERQIYEDNYNRWPPRHSQVSQHSQYSQGSQSHQNVAYTRLIQHPERSNIPQNSQTLQDSRLVHTPDIAEHASPRLSHGSENQQYPQYSQHPSINVAYIPDRSLNSAHIKSQSNMRAMQMPIPLEKGNDSIVINGEVVYDSGYVYA